MKIWPFSKKTKKSDHFELPQGVVLAPDDTEESLPNESHELAEADYSEHEEALLESSPNSQPLAFNETHKAAALKEEAFTAQHTLADFSNSHRTAPAMEIKAPAESSMLATSVPAPYPPASKSQTSGEADFVWSTDSSEYEDFIPPSDPSLFKTIVVMETVETVEKTAPAAYELDSASLPDSHEPTDIDDWVSPEQTASMSAAKSSDEDFLWPEQATIALNTMTAVDEFLAPPDLRANESNSDFSDSSALPAPFKAAEADDWLEPSPLLAAAAHEALNTASVNNTKVEPTDLLDYVDHSESLSELYTHPTHTSETWLSDVLAESPPSSLASLPLVTPKHANPEHTKKNGKPPKLKGFKEPVKEEDPKKKAEKNTSAEVKKTAPVVSTPSEPVPQPTKPQVLPVTPAEKPKAASQSHFAPQRQLSGASRIVPPGHLDRQNANPLAPYEDSLSDNLERFGKTIIHEDARFLKSSIDKLVEGYFSKQSSDDDF